MNMSNGVLAIHVETDDGGEVRIGVVTTIGTKQKTLQLRWGEVEGAKEELKKEVVVEVDTLINDLFDELTDRVKDGVVRLECPTCGLVFDADFQTTVPKLIPCPDRDCSCTLTTEELTEVI